jgi:hypothetical protein
MAEFRLLATQGAGPREYPATVWPMFDGQWSLLPAGGVMLLVSGGIWPLAAGLGETVRKRQICSGV